MANAKKCDRCGRYFDANTEHTRTVAAVKCYYVGVSMRTSGGHNIDARDLCDECITKFKRFINGEDLR